MSEIHSKPETDEHGPEFPYVEMIPCECCGGDGGTYEGGNERWITCRACNGEGTVEVEMQPLNVDDLEFGPIYTRMPR